MNNDLPVYKRSTKPLRKLLSCVIISALLPFTALAATETEIATATGTETATGDLLGAPFSDVDTSSLYFEPLRYLKEKEIIEGYKDGSFQVDKAMNRAEALKMLYTAVGEADEAILAIPGSMTFPDVATDAWFAPFVEHARSQNVVKGYPDGTFKAGNLINKVEALKILLTIFEEDTSEIETSRRFELGGGKDIWYAPFVLQAYDLGLLNSLNPEDYSVAGNVTRGEMAQMLYRLMYIRENNKATFQIGSEGRVSYYSNTLVGNPTASGDPYLAELFTAAHPDAPLRSFVQVIDESAKKSMLVHINDRGPFGGGVLDLSEAAFEVFYKTSKGIFEGKILPLSATLQAPTKGYVRGAFLENMRTSSPLPDIFWQHEVYLLPVANDSETPVLSLIAPSKKIEIIEATRIGTKKVYQLSFAEQGTYTLERPGNVTVSEKLTVLPRFQGKYVDRWSPPEVVLAYKKTPDLHLEWAGDIPKDTMLRLTMAQGERKKEIYINAGEIRTAFLHGPLFQDFDFSQKLLVVLDGARASTRFSHDVYTPWENLARLETVPSSSTQGEKPTAEAAPTDTLEPQQIPEEDMVPLVQTLSASAVEQLVLNRVNQERAKVNVAALALDATLNAMATYKSEDMATKKYFSHANPEGQDVNAWKQRFNFVPMVAENIAYSTEGLQHALDNLVKSPGHYANMIDPRFEIMGAGTAFADRKTYLTQHFSTRPVSSQDIVNKTSDLRERVALSGVTASFDPTIGAVAQRWCDDISTRSQMSFTLAGREIGSVLRDEIGNYGFSMAVYGDNSLETISKRLVEQVQKNATASAYGFGLAQGQDGLIRLTVVVQK